MQTTRTPNRRPRRRAAQGVLVLAMPAAILFAAGNGHADVPTLGGLMNHVNVGVVPNAGAGAPFQLTASIDSPQPGGMEMVGPGTNLDPPYDVLNNKAYNAQYGWLRSGRWGLTTDETFYIELLSQTDGLQTYEGGLGIDSGGTGVISGGHSLAPIFGTDISDDRWAWDLTMSHNWYASTQPGALQATYRLYVENTTTGQLSGTFEPATITLTFTNNVSRLPGDYNASGQVEQGDLDLVLLNWGADTAAGAPAGWVGDLPQGLIDQQELDGVLLNWGNTAEPSGSAVPEPATATFLGLAGLTLLRRRAGRVPL